MGCRAVRVLREESRDAEGGRRREVDDEEVACVHRALSKGNAYANSRTTRRALDEDVAGRISIGFSRECAGRGLVRGVGGRSVGFGKERGRGLCFAFCERTDGRGAAVRKEATRARRLSEAVAGRGGKGARPVRNGAGNRDTLECICYSVPTEPACKTSCRRGRPALDVNVLFRPSHVERAKACPCPTW